MCHSRLVRCNKCTALMGMLLVGLCVWSGGGGGDREDVDNSVLFTQFCCEPKTAVKSLLIKDRNNILIINACDRCRLFLIQTFSVK